MKAFIIFGALAVRGIPIVDLCEAFIVAPDLIAASGSGTRVDSFSVGEISPGEYLIARERPGDDDRAIVVTEQDEDTELLRVDHVGDGPYRISGKTIRKLLSGVE